MIKIAQLFQLFLRLFISTNGVILIDLFFVVLIKLLNIKSCLKIRNNLSVTVLNSSTEVESLPKVSTRAFSGRMQLYQI